MRGRHHGVVGTWTVAERYAYICMTLSKKAGLSLVYDKLPLENVSIYTSSTISGIPNIFILGSPDIGYGSPVRLCTVI